MVKYAKMEREYETLSPEEWLLEEIFLKTRTKWGIEVKGERIRKKLKRNLENI